jgi:hypothetical protein
MSEQSWEQQAVSEIIALEEKLERKQKAYERACIWLENYGENTPQSEVVMAIASQLEEEIEVLKDGLKS